MYPDSSTNLSHPQLKLDPVEPLLGNAMIKTPKSAKSNMKQLDTAKATFHKNSKPEVQITNLKPRCMLPFLGKSSHVDKMSKDMRTSGTRISKRKKTDANSVVKKVVFHSNPQAGGEIKDFQRCHKMKSLGTDRPLISEACECVAQMAERKKRNKTMKIKIYLPCGKQMFIHQNPEAELYMMDLR